MAARILQDETDKWEEENNSIVMVAKRMAQQMLQMAQFARGRGELQVSIHSFAEVLQRIQLHSHSPSGLRNLALTGSDVVQILENLCSPVATACI